MCVRGTANEAKQGEVIDVGEPVTVQTQLSPNAHCGHARVEGLFHGLSHAQVSGRRKGGHELRQSHLLFAHICRVSEMRTLVQSTQVLPVPQVIGVQ